MSEKWLPQGELDHTWYYLHLIAWAMMILGISVHLLMSARVGGVSLLLSILNFKFRPQDSPALWSGHIRNWLSRRSKGTFK